MKTIFDIGMFDGLDTRYYLEEGYHVVAVEANPFLISRAEDLFQYQINSGQLQLIHAAVIDDSRDSIELRICGDDLAASSIYEEKITARKEIGSYSLGTVKVPTIKLDELVMKFGVPHYLKVDIEGADRVCILSLSAERKPTYLSFEAGADLEELIAHLGTIGYRFFKIIDQCNFRELSNQRLLYDRIARRIINALGYSQPQYLRVRGGRYFKFMYSSGPAPWSSDGKWCSDRDLLMKWNRAKESGQLRHWYDVHAM